jgi:hypothetical protein
MAENNQKLIKMIKGEGLDDNDNAKGFRRLDRETVREEN